MNKKNVIRYILVAFSITLLIFIFLFYLYPSNKQTFGEYFKENPPQSEQVIGIEENPDYAIVFSESSLTGVPSINVSYYISNGASWNTTGTVGAVKIDSEDPNWGLFNLDGAYAVYGSYDHSKNISISLKNSKLSHKTFPINDKRSLWYVLLDENEFRLIDEDSSNMYVVESE